MRTVLWSFLILLASAATTARADYQMRFCNQASTNLQYAVGYYDNQNGLTTNGWYSLDPGACSDTWSSTIGTMYVFGSAKQGLREWRGGESLCVDQKGGGTTANADRIACNGATQMKKGFVSIDLQDGANTYNFSDAVAVITGAQVTICNQTPKTTNTAVAYWSTANASWTSMGWVVVDPGKCDFANNSTEHQDVYVFSQNNDSDLEWNGDTSLCIDGTNIFNFPNAASRPCTGTNEIKRSFKKYMTDSTGQLTINLKQADAKRVAFNVNVCNKGEYSIGTQIGTETDQGLVADGWTWIDAGACHTFIRRGKLDAFYLHGMTSGHLLEWAGDTQLCVTQHSGFTTANADSVACADGDSYRMGFFKVPLSQGVGEYDLKPENAAAHKYALNACNNYSENIFVATGGKDSLAGNGLLTNGWLKLRPGECILLSALDQSPAYLTAFSESGAKTWAGTDAQLCVNQLWGFSVPNADQGACNGQNQARRGFVRWSVTPGANVYTFQ